MLLTLTVDFLLICKISPRILNSNIHSLCIPRMLHMVAGVLEPIPNDMG